MLNSAYWQRSSVVEQRTHKPFLATKLVSNFIESRREGLSNLSIKYYQSYLNRANSVIGVSVTGQDVAYFIRSLKCSGGGKHAYFRVLKTFYN